MKEYEKYIACRATRMRYSTDRLKEILKGKKYISKKYICNIVRMGACSTNSTLKPLHHTCTATTYIIHSH